MNINDLVTQVQGGEEEEEEQQGHQQPNGIHLVPANEQKHDPNPHWEAGGATTDDDEAEPSFCRKVFCCASSANSNTTKNGKRKTTQGRNGNGNGHHAAVPLQSNGPISGGNQNHSRVDSTPSVSASGVAMGINHSQNTPNQQSTVGLNSRDGQPLLNNSNPPPNKFGAPNNNNDPSAHYHHQLTPGQYPPPPPLPPLRDSNNIVTPPPAKYLLNPLPPEDIGKKCLVLDLDETLVHSSFKPIPNADFVISIELENVIHRVYVRKRPGVDHFMRVVGEKFEVVIFTASLSKYADPLLDILDRGRVVKARLFREACVQHYGNYVKDLSHLGRRMEDILIVDNSPFSYMFQPDNAIPITSWFNDKNDRQLYELLPFLDSMLNVDDVSHVLQRSKPRYGSGIGVPPNLLPPNFQPSVQDPDIMNAMQKRGQ